MNLSKDTAPPSRNLQKSEVPFCRTGVFHPLANYVRCSRLVQKACVQTTVRYPFHSPFCLFCVPFSFRVYSRLIYHFHSSVSTYLFVHFRVFSWLILLFHSLFSFFRVTNYAFIFYVFWFMCCQAQQNLILNFRLTTPKIQCTIRT